MSSLSPSPPREAGASPAPATPRPGPSSASGLRWIRRLVVALLIVSALLTVGYTCASIFAATLLVAGAPQAMTKTPAEFGLDYRNVTFPSREDNVTLKAG